MKGCKNSDMASVLITGGTGLIGRHLTQRLLQKGYEVGVLSRRKSQASEFRTYTWDLDKNEVRREAITTADYIVHLAGANIGDKRWTTIRKRYIIDSRVLSTELIYSKLKKHPIKLKAFISASAIGYYGATTSNKIFT